MPNAHDRQSVLQVSPEDNLLVALRDLGQGVQIEWEEKILTVADEIPAKHKLATCDLSIGDSAYM
jgi:altronate hydrolase